ncbi:GNAT family N-acetyltransferase [Bacteroides caecigallinarum]|uniref:GNAT family N-acetyltransferase n=1 Tax=Bacteroides caecigallinarum TaxID=1411144 RepID=UPI001F36BCA3|nr:GNAT family N-acetyltransferase [Bacteroides caecigallinarum]MCF2592800.1 GNAT family N-acetyltransferase [Bacteroides caecigallinarum]
MDRQINYRIRPLEEKDLYDMQNLFRSTVLNVNIKDYTKEEVEDWASCGDDIKHWKEILFNNQFIGAFDKQDNLIGYSSMNKNGYMHSMFVHKDWQGKGVATLLLSEVEKIARQYEVIEITLEVSKTARPFFEHKGYVVECEQKQQANRLKLTNYKMKKVL